MTTLTTRPEKETMFSILSSGPRCLVFESQRSQNYIRGEIIDFAVVNRWRSLEEIGQWLENAD